MKRRILKGQLRCGRIIEREHTKSPRVAKKIALDHLREHRNYYTRLARVEPDVRKKCPWVVKRKR